MLPANAADITRRWNDTLSHEADAKGGGEDAQGSRAAREHCNSSQG
jgi:hypothetical protein